MIRFLFSLLIVFLFAPAAADACEQRFRAGQAAYRAHLQGLQVLQAEVYGPGSWINADQLLARLENRSALTTQCDELAAVRARFDALSAALDTAQRQFHLAVALCSGVNRDRAQDNLAVLAAARRALDDEVDFLTRVARSCHPP